MMASLTPLWSPFGAAGKAEPSFPMRHQRQQKGIHLCGWIPCKQGCSLGVMVAGTLSCRLHAGATRKVFKKGRLDSISVPQKD